MQWLFPHWCVLCGGGKFSAVENHKRWHCYAHKQHLHLRKHSRAGGALILDPQSGCNVPLGRVIEHDKHAQHPTDFFAKNMAEVSFLRGTNPPYKLFGFLTTILL